MRPYPLLLALTALGLVACGSSGGPIQQPSQPPLPSATQTPNETADSTKPTTDTTPPSSNKAYDVDFVEAKMATPPEKAPRISVDVPGIEQVIPVAQLPSVRVRFKVKDTEKLPPNWYVQFVLDGQYSEPVLSPTQPVMLTELAGPGGLKEGQHIIAAAVCLENNECIKSEKSITVHKFFVGKKSSGGWSRNDPLLVVTSPGGTYPGDALVDWYLLNGTMGKNAYSLRVSINGPGVKPGGIQRVITEWHPWVVLSAHDGETYKAKFELLDPNGELVPLGTVEREFRVIRD